MKACKNCGKEFSQGGKFCPHCGQRDFDGRLRMRDIIGNFLANITHLDNKFITMSWQLLIPARVTKNYFKGQISRYPHPLQFFFIVMFFFLLMFGKHFGVQSFNILGGNLQLGVDNSIQVGDVKVSESQLYEALERCKLARDYRDAGAALPPEWQIDTTRLALDSIHRKLSDPWEQATLKLLLDMQLEGDSTINLLDTLTFLNGLSNIRIASFDIVTLDPDTIIKRYGYHDFLDKLIVRQGIKSIKDQRGFITQYLGSFAWAVLLQIAFMALLLRLLYWKKGHYYVEHFIFLLHQQSGAFLLLTMAMVINNYLFPLGFFWLIIFAWIGIYRLIGLHRYYGGKWWLSGLRWLVFMLFNYLFLLFFFVVTLMAVFALF